MSAFQSFTSGGLAPRLNRAAVLAMAVAAFAATPQVSRAAAIAGFGNFSGFAINQNDAGAPPTVSIAGGSITLTNTGGGEARSIFATTKQDVSKFSASYTFAGTADYDGSITFVIQNGPAGAAAVGTGVSAYEGITPSIGVNVNFNGSSTATLAKNGVMPAGSTTSGINLGSGHPIDAKVSYDGSIVHQELKDTVTSVVWSTDYILSPSLVSQLGSSTAYVGFTAGNGKYGNTQTISNFQFTSVPEPAALAATMLAGFLGVRRRR